MENVLSYFGDEFDTKEIDFAGRVLVNVPTPGEDDKEWVEAFELGVNGGPPTLVR